MADDFRVLLAATRRTWERLVSLRACGLCKATPVIIVDANGACKSVSATLASVALCGTKT